MGFGVRLTWGPLLTGSLSCYMNLCGEDNLLNSFSSCEMGSYGWGSVKVNSKSGELGVWGRMSPIFLCGQSKTLVPSHVSLTFAPTVKTQRPLLTTQGSLQVTGKGDLPSPVSGPHVLCHDFDSWIYLVNWYLLRSSLC